MGCWGPGLYQDDVAEYVRDYYNEQLRRGKKGIEITQELIDKECSSADSDDAIIFWLALADTQWNLGRLERRVRERALAYLQTGGDIVRWKYESPKDVHKREIVLYELKQKLMSQQPEEKKISLYKLYSCEWETGDVYAYLIKSEYAKERGIDNRYFMFHKIGETYCHPGHIVPIVRVKITADEKLPLNEEMFDDMEYVQISATNFEDRFLPFDIRRPIEEQIAERSKISYERDEFGFLPQYRMILMNTSRRTIPKNLIYVGNFKNIAPPQIEFVPHDDLAIQCINWKFLEQIVIDRYCGYNLRQYKDYF